MKPKLPAALERYFAATQGHDVERMSAAFADDAIVKDEGKEHRGIGQIRSWMKDTIERYAFVVEPIGVRDEGDKTVVQGVVSGKFPGSPVTLSHAFTLRGDKIAALEIK